MTKRTGRLGKRKRRNGACGTLAGVLRQLVAGITAMRTHLLEWVHTLDVRGLSTAEAEARAGPKGVRVR
jgi:hypothetical protein